MRNFVYPTQDTTIEMNAVHEELNTILKGIVKAHVEDRPVCTICAEEMYTECRKVFATRANFSERRKIISFKALGQEVRLQVVECAYVFDDDNVHQNMIVDLCTTFGKAYGKILFFCSSAPQFLMQDDIDGVYIHRFTTPAKRKVYGPLHNVLICTSGDHVIAYDASFQHFQTVVGTKPTYLIVNEIYP